MKVKIPPVKFSRHLREWAVPLFSVATFIPLCVVYLASSKPETAPTRSVIPSPPPIAPVADRSLLPPSPIAPKPLESPLIQPSPDKKPLPAVEKKPEVKTAKPPAKVPDVAKNAKEPAKAPTIAKKAHSHRSIARRPPVKQHARQHLVVPANYTPPPLEIRVAIEQDVNSVVIGVSSPAIVTDRNGRGLKTIAPGEGLWVSPDGSGLKMGDSSLPEVIFVQPTTRDGLVYVDDRWYRGKVLLVSRGSSLLVVNHVNLEEYLYSVVGSEMHSTAPAEALKAQAIAARSYALVHMIRPASPWFNLGNTQRWQVYKGIQSEYQSTHNAVNATAGQILSYKGGVVESLYAATDEIVQWAHGGRGMSQTGAYQLANQGYDHQRILGNYYPGVSVARLVLQQ
ncbi:SpoIID/LytB domain-containing protein [Pannus brasiliensis CCIBt3594]|uniref:SpoIID/LytB domain-containing protein n=1 Tax=Pannus brasiliensis CCIBt3594 TaxID=1427578 RepID=A0AAW9QYQ5_9CHRO